MSGYKPKGNKNSDGLEPPNENSSISKKENSKSIGTIIDELLNQGTMKINRIDLAPRILQYYEKLNDLGKNEATKRVEELTYFPQYTDSQLLNAAHAYEGKSEEAKKHDDDIMDNDDEWT